jgi:MFS family permease
VKLFYGWVVVGAGIVVTCIGFGAMLSLSVFLQPMSEAMGWSRTGISTAALINWLCMGVGTFVWGALSDRIGTRTVVLCGGILLGLGLLTASQAVTLGQLQVLFGLLVGVATGSFYVPMTVTTTRWFTRHRSLALALVSAGISVGSATVGPLARWIITGYDWRIAMFVIGELASFYALALMFGFAYGGVMPLYAILVREYFGARIMGTAFGAVAFLSTLGMALGPLAGGWLYDSFGSYFWLYMGSFGIGVGAVAIAVTFRAPSRLPAAMPAPSLAR